MLSLRHGQIYPAGGEDAPEVAVSEEGDVPFQQSELHDELICAKGNLRGRLPPWGTIQKEIPMRMPGMHFHRSVALKVAMIPLGEIWVDNGLCLQPGEGAGLECAHQRTRQHSRERDASQPFPERAGRFLAMLGQWDVRASSVLP